MIGRYAVVEQLPILVSRIFWRLAPTGVPLPVLPFVEHHKPHDIPNTLFSPRHCAFAVQSLTSLMEHFRQFIVRSGLAAFFFQQVLCINPAAANFSTLDLLQVLEAKQQTAREISELVFAANG